jgi:hypothetical protein
MMFRRTLTNCCGTTLSAPQQLNGTYYVKGMLERVLHARKRCERCHDESTRDQDRLTANLIDPYNSRDGCKEHTNRVMSVICMDVGVSTYTTPTTPVARRLIVLPVKPKSAKMLGA